MSKKTFNNATINVEFNEAKTRENIKSGESLNTLFGKIKKVISDLHESAFTGSVDTVNGHTVESDVPTNAKFTDTVYSHPTTSGNKHIPSGGSVGQILKNSDDGTAEWSDLKIGGTNLILNSLFMNGGSKWGCADTTTLTITGDIAKVVPSSTKGTGCSTSITKIYYDTKGDYIFSAVMKADAVREVVVSLLGYDSTNATVYIKSVTLSLTTNWQYFKSAFKCDKSDIVKFVVAFTSSSSNTTAFYFKYPKLERGTEATDWSPSPYDLPTTLVATTSANGLMSAADKTKLDGVATGATANVVKYLALTIPVANWNSSKQVVITATGVTASNNVFVFPTHASQGVYIAHGIACTAQAANSLTFTYYSAKPPKDLDVIVLIIS